MDHERRFARCYALWAAATNYRRYAAAPTTRRRRRMPILAAPLARYGFPTITTVALLTGQLYPALVCDALTALAWKAHR